MPSRRKMRPFAASPEVYTASPRVKERVFTSGKMCSRKSGESLANRGSLPRVAVLLERTSSPLRVGERPERMAVSSYTACRW